ncbi:hypothetical protein F5883DRAFT_533037 [Diaporthe sp. PMI_573]|nr:hypothetical protein F5883DRAFT_533037 [Diaporthaceae sp. PMI_573]
MILQAVQNTHKSTIYPMVPPKALGARWARGSSSCAFTTMARATSSQHLVTRASVSYLALSRSKCSNAACKDRVMVVVQYSTKWLVRPGSWLESETPSTAKPEGEVKWELGGTIGCFWTCLQRRRHQMAGWVAYGMAIGTLQSLPRPKVLHAHGLCRLPGCPSRRRLSAAPSAGGGDEKEKRLWCTEHDDRHQPRTPASTENLGFQVLHCCLFCLTGGQGRATVPFALARRRRLSLRKLQLCWGDPKLCGVSRTERAQ